MAYPHEFHDRHLGLRAPQGLTRDTRPGRWEGLRELNTSTADKVRVSKEFDLKTRTQFVPLLTFASAPPLFCKIIIIIPCKCNSNHLSHPQR